jgi:hypothetical protein
MNKENESPFIIEFTMVHCAGYNWMAYRDESGRWRDAYDNFVLPEPVKVLRYG